jgi:hypothetical protein
MNKDIDITSISEILGRITVRASSAFVREDHLHRKINQHLLDSDHDTITRSDLIHYMISRGYQRFLDASDRTIWRGIGLLSDRKEETVVPIEEIYPVRIRSIGNEIPTWS